MKKIYGSIICCLVFIISSTASEKVFYPASFNPMKGMIHESEKDFRQEICLNGKWQFMPVYQSNAEDFKLPSSFKWDQTPIKIPSPWNVNSFTDGKGGDFVAYPSYPKKWEDARIGWMQKMVSIPTEWDGKQFKLHFEGVMGKVMIYVNGTKVAENFELFLPFEVDVTDYLKVGQENEILVGVAKGDLFDQPGKYGRRTYVGGSMWGIEMVGIWQDVFLFALPKIHVEDIFVQPDVANNLLKIELDVANNTNKKVSINIDGEVKKWYNLAGKTLAQLPEQKDALSEKASLFFSELKKVSIEPNSISKVTLEVKVTDELNFWTPETPNLYGAIINLKEGKQIVDKKYERFGWRQFSILGDKLLLNGEQVTLKGDSWHFTGVPQMTRRYAWAWFNMLKDVNANAVRLHAQPFPRFYLDVADEMGICVLNETGIWSSDGGPKIDSEEYWDSCVEHLSRLIKRDKNHASVFGWSVCNETVPVAVHVFKAPEALVERQLQEINRWVEVTASLDPTRPWISGDGETDRPTILPTVIGHYGDTNAMKSWASQGKPWGIGEQSMAYYGTPKQASAYNGNRAYESMLGRMEGVAIESYDLLKTQHENNASYSSIFNIAWYALQPLPLGLKDQSRQPNLEDGIFFSYEENAYGMQPERLGPYTTTLNPGYDASLPLYKSWPLFDAIRSVNASPMLPNPVKIIQEENEKISVLPADAVILLSNEKSLLKNELEESGLQITTNGKPTRSTLLIVDGNQPPTEAKQVELIKKAIELGARILVVGITPESATIINTILPFKVSLEERHATSFLVEKQTKELQGLTHADFYFSELIPKEKTALKYGLAGDFAMKATPLLRACNTDWQRWNYQAETSKTGNVFRSEQESKNSDLVIGYVMIGNSQVVISSLDLSEIKQETKSITTNILTNMGARISNENLNKMQALDSSAKLQRALVWGPHYNHDRSLAFLLEHDFLKGESNIVPTLNMTSGGDTWSVIARNEENSFEFSNARASGDNQSPVIYMSYWLYSPRSLSNLLAEPNMPSLDMFLQASGGAGVWLNNKPVYSEQISSDNSEVKISNIMLDKGWNHMVIKLVDNKANKETRASVRFDSADKTFMKQLMSSVVR